MNFFKLQNIKNKIIYGSSVKPSLAAITLTSTCLQFLLTTADVNVKNMAQYIFQIISG